MGARPVHAQWAAVTTKIGKAEPWLRWYITHGSGRGGREDDEHPLSLA